MSPRPGRIVDIVTAAGPGLGTSHEREIKRLRPRVEAINALEPAIAKLSEAELKAKTAEFKQKLDNGASLDDGELDVAVIGPMKKRELITTYPQLFKGTHVSNPRYVHYRGREITVAAPGITGYADGERIGALPLTVTVQPSALRVVVA